MAIYKSSFNQKPEKEEKRKKEEKPKKEKREKIKQPKERSSKKINIRPSLIGLFIFLGLFVACCFPNNFLKNFLLGIFGLVVYPATLLGVFFSLVALRRIKYNVRKKYVTYISIAVTVVLFVFHLILTSKLSLDSFGGYLVETYKAKTTAGGLLFSLLSFPMVKVLTVVGAYIVSGIILAIFVGLIADYVSVERKINKVEQKSKFDFNNFEDFEINEEPVIEVSKEERIKKEAKQKLGLEKGESKIISSNMPRYDVRKFDEKTMSKKDYILTPIEPIIEQEESQELFKSMPKKPYIYENTISSARPSTSSFSYCIL